MKYVLTHVMMAMVLVVSLAVAVWATDRTPPIFVLAYWIVTKEIHPGSQVEVRYIVYRKRQLPQRIEHAIFVGDSRYPLPAWNSETSPNGLDTFNLTFFMPQEAPPGAARYQATFVWRDPINAIHWYWPIRLTLEPQEFEITSPEKVIER